MFCAGECLFIYFFKSFRYFYFGGLNLFLGFLKARFMKNKCDTYCSVMEEMLKIIYLHFLNAYILVRNVL